MNRPPKTVVKTNGRRGRPKPPFDPYVVELQRLLEDSSANPPPNLYQASIYLARWSLNEAGKTALLNHGAITPLKASAILKRLNKRYHPIHYRISATRVK